MRRKKGSGSKKAKKGSGSFPRVGSGPAAWSEFYGDNEPDPISPERIGNSSLTLGHRIVDAAGDTQTLYADGHSVLA